jgi:hypothetical protein
MLKWEVDNLYKWSFKDKLNEFLINHCMWFCHNVFNWLQFVRNTNNTTAGILCACLFPTVCYLWGLEDRLPGVCGGWKGASGFMLWDCGWPNFPEWWWPCVLGHREGNAHRSWFMGVPCEAGEWIGINLHLCRMHWCSLSREFHRLGSKSPWSDHLEKTRQTCVVRGRNFRSLVFLSPKEPTTTTGKGLTWPSTALQG